MKTYECKIKDDEAFSFIRSMNIYFGVLVRKLYVKLYGNPVRDKNELKRDFCRKHQCSSTHYNSIKNHVDAVYRSRKELGEEEYKNTLTRIKQTKDKIGKLAKTISDHRESISRIKEYNRGLLLHKVRVSLKIKSKKPKKPNRIIDKIPIKSQREMISQTEFTSHQKKRRLAILEKKEKKGAELIKTGKWPLCFGTKKLLRKQNFLNKNGYKDFSEWLEDWRFSRSNQSFWLGDSTEKGRNRNVKLNLEDGVLRLTVPEKLRDQYEAFVTVKGIKFDDRAHKAIKAALEPHDDQKPSPLTYRLLEREKTIHTKDGSFIKRRNIYLQVSVNPPQIPIETRCEQGAIGVDLNHDHMAIGEVDRHGNPIQAFDLSFDIEGKSSNQINAIFGDCIKKIVSYAKLKNKPIVIEKLDFRKKKSVLRETHGPRGARILSSFAYSKFKEFIASRSARYGVELLKVNPAYSSVLGAFN